MTTEEHPEAPVVLARCGVCKVEQCPGCELVHVHVGSVSLRLTPAAFMAVCATLLEAARAIPLSRSGERH